MKNILLLVLLVLSLSDKAIAGRTIMDYSSEAIAGSTLQYLRLQLAKDAINTDEILIIFKTNTSTAYEPKTDAAYFQGNGQVSFSSLSSDNIKLTFNTQPFPKTSTAIALNVGTKASGLYQLNMREIIDVPKLFDIWLIDNYKNDSLDMRHNKTYNFNVLKTDSNSFGTKRFKLVIRQNPAYTYRLLFFNAEKINSAANVANVSGIKVVWETENEQNYTNFTVERSVDNGKNFKILDTVRANETGSYSILDKGPVIGPNLYRLKQENINKVITFSKMVQVTYSNNAAELMKSFKNNPSVYPNPVSDRLNVAVNAQSVKSESYNITVTNISGFVVRNVITAQANWQDDVANLLPGTYFVKVFNNKDKSLVGYSTFLKR